MQQRTGAFSKAPLTLSCMMCSEVILCRKKVLGRGVGERFRNFWHAVFLKVLELGITVLVFGTESWRLARNVESLGLGGLPFSCEPLCRWISGKLSAAFASSSSNILGRNVSMCCR